MEQLIEGDAPALARDVVVAQQRHRLMRGIARRIYLLPGAKSMVRGGARLAIQHLPVSLKNRHRLYYFFAAEPELAQTVTCRAGVPGGRPLRLTLDLREQMASDWYYWGTTGYERGTARLLNRLLKRRSCFFDVGANIGYHTLPAASLMQGRGQVHAFEPLPAAFGWLSKGADLNGLEDLHLNEMALSDEDAEARLFLSTAPSRVNASLIARASDRKEHLVVRTIRFDTYCRIKGIRRVDLMKVDVEGGELKVLSGMGSLLKEWLPDLILEVLPQFEEELDRFFMDKPYRKFLIRDDCLEASDRLRADREFRNYYLTKGR